MNNTNTPLVSIIIPYFNCEKYIAETLDSVKKQTYANIEVILVNDGSSVASTEYVQSLIQNTDMIYIYQENQGVSAARNTGGKTARGEFLLFLDADNIIYPEYIQKTVNVLLANTQCKIAYTRAEFFEAKTGEWILPPYTHFKNLLLGNHIDTLALVRKSDFDQLNGFDENLATHEDWDYWIRLLKDGGTVIRIDEILFSYRKRYNETSLIDKLSKNQEENKKSWQNIYQKHQDLFIQNNLSYYDCAQSFLNIEKLSKRNQNLENEINKLYDNTSYLELQKNEFQSNINDLNKKIQELSTHIVFLNNTIHNNNFLHHKFKKLWIIRILKPFIKLEQALHSLNRYRKSFRLLMREKGSFGKAYQFLRRMWIRTSFKETKQFLKNFPSIFVDSFGISNVHSYQIWIQNNDTYTKQQYMEMAENIKKFTYMPKISVLMPVYNVDIKWLTMAIDSVIEQVYTNWELCISDDASPNTQIHTVLKKYMQKDSRIKVVFRQINGHISENSNSALEITTGEWLALMDHDDLLPKHALYEVVKSLQNQQDAVLVYSDEDKVDEHNKRFMPHFKSDFNLDLLYGQNYISHLGVYKTDIAKKIGGFRKGLEGSQDYDFLLRYLLQVDHKKIIHIPKILYHWRAIEGSTALSSGEKSYTTQAGIKALQYYFHQLNLDVEVTRGKADNLYRIRWNTKENPLVSLIIPTRNGYKITKQAIDSILQKTSYSNYEIILVDNDSDDKESLEYFHAINQHEKVTVLQYPHPFNYSAINNFAVKHARGEIIGLINNDIEVINDDWLTEMVSQVIRPDIGCVGAMLYYPNNTIQHAGVIIGVNGVAAHSHKHYSKDSPGYFSRLYVAQNYSAVTAACLLIRKTVFDEVGGLNEIDLTVAFNDVDLCLKVKKAGYRNLWTPYAELYHHESISRGIDDKPEKAARFAKEVQYMIDTWKTNEYQDMYYNPNLTITHEDFSISMKSRSR